jgi:hypothetical protein
LFTVGYEKIRNNKIKNKKTNLNFHCLNNHSTIAIVQILLKEKRGRMYVYILSRVKKSIETKFQFITFMVSSRIVLL